MRGARGLHAVDQDAGELGSETANTHLLAFAEIPRDGDTRNALQRLADIQVRKLADVFGRDRVDDADGVALLLKRARQATSHADDDDFLHCNGLGLGPYRAAKAREQANGCRASDRLRMVSFHDQSPFMWCFIATDRQVRLSLKTLYKCFLLQINDY